MTPNAYNDALSQAKAELIAAIQQRDHWTMEVARLQQFVNSLSTMVQSRNAAPAISVQSILAEIGLQDIVFTCVRNASPMAVSPTNVRDQIKGASLANLSKYSNPLAVIHGALKRLASQHKIREMPDGTYRMPIIYETLVGLARKK